MLNVSGAIKWIIEVVNLEISYQFYFGSFCSNWEFDFFSFRIRRSQGVRSYAHNSFSKHTQQCSDFGSVEHEKASNMYRNAV